MRRLTKRRTASSVRLAGWLLFAVALIAVPLAARQATFREAIDVIEFDVRVVNRAGTPVLNLRPDDFSVSIGRGARRVVSAEVVQYGTGASPSASATAAGGARPADSPPPVWSSPHAIATGRVFVLVIDAASFDVGSTAGIVQSTRQFVLGLQPEDRVGLYIFPTGAQISPAADRGRVLTAISRLVAEPPIQPNAEFNLRPSDLVALSPMMAGDPIGGRDAAPYVRLFCNGDRACEDRLHVEVAGQVADYEARATHSLGMLRSLIRTLAPIEARKTLVLVSGGVVTSDRPGTRPEIGNLDVVIGQEAVRTNTAIYTLYVDWRALQQGTAEQRRPRVTQTNLAADSSLLSRSLEQFTGASGGVLFKALSGSGELAFAQILRETSAYYVLGVQPAPEDRDGKPRQLSVKARRKDVTVRGSRWVTVDKR